MGTKVQALQQWCKKQTEGYRDVDVVNMTSSWKSGLAFCAIIHRYRPDLIDYDNLSKENILENNSLAFEVANLELGIPALLDAPDMVAIRVPDKLSVVTYVSQYYNYFHNKPQLGGPGVKKSVKRHQETDRSGPEAKRQTLTAGSESPMKEKQVSMGDKCGICKNKVYLLERHLENGKLFHRTCFRKSELSPTAKMLKKAESEQQETKDTQKPDFWRRRADAKKTEQEKKEEANRESKEKLETETVRTNKAKSLNFLDHVKDNTRSHLKEIPQRQEEKMEVSYSNGVHKNDNGKDDSSFKRPVPRTRTSVSSAITEKNDETKNSHNEPEKRSFMPKFEFKSKIVSTAPKACVTSKVDTDDSKPQPSVRHSAPPKPSGLSEPFAHQKSSHHPTHHPSESGSPPPLPKNQPPTLPVPSKKESPDLNKRKSSGLNAKTSPKQDRLSALLARDSQHISSPDHKKSEPSSFESENKKPHGFKHSAIAKPSLGELNIGRKASTDSEEPVAVMMSPMSPEPHDPKVLGGLLKNLAGIRKKKNSEDGGITKKEKFLKEEDHKPKKDLDGKTEKATSDGRKEVKSFFSDSASKEKADKRTEKAKSVDFLSDKKFSFGDKKESDKSKITQPAKTNISTEEVPAWKKALEEQKKKKAERPKSADLLTEKTEDKRRVVSMDVVQEKDERPAWQIEAEKRKAARQGGYIDPEKAKLEKANGKDNEEPSKTGDMKKLHIIAVSPPPKKEESKPSEPEKKKISVGKLFNFKLHDSEQENKVKDKPPRPPPMSPTSGFKSHHGLSTVVSDKLATTKKTAAPLPPFSARPKSAIKTFGDMKRMTPQEIQKQLSEIDNKLTDLEVRGRHLEESIRKDHGEEEDEGMMIEWFTLVNDKNELVRTEADLIYISRAQELEDEQHRIDRELRQLLNKSEEQRTAEDQEQEEQLIQRLVDVVNQRSLIVDCQDEDRIRYEEEDRDIAEILSKKEFCKRPSVSEDSHEHMKENSKEQRKAEKAEKKKKKKNKKEKKNKKDAE